MNSSTASATATAVDNSRTTRSIDYAIRPYHRNNNHLPAAAQSKANRITSPALSTLMERLDSEMLHCKPHPSLSPACSQQSANTLHRTLTNLPFSSTSNSNGAAQTTTPACASVVKLRVKKQRYKKMASDLKHLLKLRD